VTHISYQLGQRLDHKLNFGKDSEEERSVRRSVRVEFCIPLERLVPNRDVEPQLTVGIKFQKWIGLRDLENDDHISVLKIPFADVERCWLADSACAYELYIEGLRSSENHREEFVLIPVRKFGQNAEQRGKFRMGTVEGLKTKNGVSYSIGNAGQPNTTVLGEVFEPSPDDKSGFIPLVEIGTGGQLSDSEDEMIEGVPEISDSIAKHQTPSLEIGRLSIDPQPKPMFGELMIALVEKSVRFSFDPCLDFTIYGIEVTARPS
jgi:hypothetical protein